MLEGLLIGLQTALSMQNLLMVIGGCLIGTFIGMLPGLGPMSIIAIMIPVAISMGDPSAALILLAMQAANSTDPAEYGAKIMDVANAPGEVINPGELGKALELIAAGKDVDFQGATGVELIGPGESAGSYREILVKDGVNTTVKFR